MVEVENEAELLLLDVLWEACGADEGWMIDNRSMSSYEDACEYLRKKGYLTKKNDRIFFIKDD